MHRPPQSRHPRPIEVINYWKLTGCGLLGRPHYKNVRKNGHKFGGLASIVIDMSRANDGLGFVARFNS